MKKDRNLPNKNFHRSKFTQISKSNHHSTKGVIIADDTDTALPNADKNNKITEISHKNIENQINPFINT